MLAFHALRKFVKRRKLPATGEGNMTWRRLSAGLFGSIPVLILGACGSSETMRYKMIVEVETPEGLRTGVAVREIRFTKPSSLPSIGESRPQLRIKGEAVAVDLPGGRTLFALLTNAHNDPEYATRIPYEHLGWMSPEGTTDDTVELWPDVPFKPHHNPEISRPAYLPMLVTFREIGNPKSVEAVEPEALDSAFGRGVRLKRITIQVTDDSVTRGIEEKLKWLTAHRGSLDFSGRLHPANREKDVTASAFVQGAN